MIKLKVCPQKDMFGKGVMMFLCCRIDSLIGFLPLLEKYTWEIRDDLSCIHLSRHAFREQRQLISHTFICEFISFVPDLGEILWKTRHDAFLQDFNRVILKKILDNLTLQGSMSFPLLNENSALPYIFCSLHSYIAQFQVNPFHTVTLRSAVRENLSLAQGSWKQTKTEHAAFCRAN